VFTVKIFLVSQKYERRYKQQDTALTFLLVMFSSSPCC